MNCFELCQHHNETLKISTCCLNMFYQISWHKRGLDNSPISSAIALNGQVWLVELAWRNFGLICINKIGCWLEKKHEMLKISFKTNMFLFTFCKLFNMHLAITTLIFRSCKIFFYKGYCTFYFLLQNVMYNSMCYLPFICEIY